MKYFKLFIVTMLTVTLLTACGGGASEDGTGSGALKDIKVSIEDGEFVQLADDAVRGQTNGSSYLRLTVKIENKGKDSISIGEDDFSLYSKEDDSKISVLSVSSSIDKGLGYENVLSGKNVTGNIYFSINEEEEYELYFSPFIYTENGDKSDIKLEINPSDYAESLTTISDAKKAADAYVDTIFFDKDNADYDKLFAIDKQEAKEQAKESIIKNIKESFYSSNKVSDEGIERLVTAFLENQNSRANVTMTLKNCMNGSASVSIQGGAISISKSRNASSEGISYNASEEEIIAAYIEGFGTSDLSDASSYLELELTYDSDGKWSVDLSKKNDYFDNSRVVDFFTGGGY